ncbi:hypothetical protein [Formosa sp. A9]|uniref:hypothetical protein n=1 Tax=Formosa sp. A9 TaxID=3442641 RepID=UPI003EBA7711
MKKLVVVISLLTLCHCAAPKATRKTENTVTGVMVEKREPVKNSPGFYKYYMYPLNGKSRAFIVISPVKFEEKKPVYFNQTQVQ